MKWQSNAYTYMLFATALIAAGMSVAAWKRRPKAGSLPLAATMFGLFIWSLAQALEISAIEVSAKIFLSKIQYVGIVIVPTAWLMLALEYTGLAAEWLTARNKWLFLIHPILTVAAVWTNELHHWVWTEVTIVPFRNLWMWEASYGAGFWIHTAYSYFLLLMGLLLLIYLAISSPPPYRNQTLILLSGAVVPWLANALSIFNVIHTPVNLTGFAFTLAGVVAFWGLFRYQLLDLVPVARDVVVDSMQDGMIALDVEGRVVDANTTSAHLLQLSPSNILGRTLRDLMPACPAWMVNVEHLAEVHRETPLTLGGESGWYDVRISPLYDARHHTHGHIVLLHDISARKQLEASLEAQIVRVNQLLKVAQTTTESPSLHATMQNTLAVARSMTQAENGSLILVNERREIVHSICNCEMSHPHHAFDLTPTAKMGFMDTIAQTKSFLTRTEDECPSWLSATSGCFPVRSALGVAIEYGQTFLGGLFLTHVEAEHFSEADVEILEVAARQMALALANALVYEDQRIIAEQQTTLFEVLRTLQHPMTLQQATEEVVEVIAQLTEWPVVALLTVDSANGLSLDTIAGQLASQWVNSLHAKAESTPPTGIMSPSKAFDLDMIQDQSYPSLLLVPLKGKLQRVLLVAADVPQAFDEEARLLANSLGNVVALVLRNAQLYERVSLEQRRLSALVHSSRDGILMLSPDAQILVISQMAIHYLSLPGTPQDWLYRSMPEALSHLRAYAPEVVRSTLAETRRLQNGETSPGEGEYQIKGRTIHWFNMPVMTEDQSLGRLLVLHDVTEERQVAQMREDLTYTMVHDLRNPLTSIHSSIWLLRKQLQHTIPTNYRTLLEIAQRSTIRLLDLVNAILDISRLESGYMPLNCAHFSLADLVTDILELQSPLAQEKQITLLQEHVTQLTHVDADRALIGRVLQNLIGNALKFTPEGGMVKLSLQHSADEDTPKVQLSIRDTGPGILPEIRDQLFEKFVTGQQTGHGSGLGLTFCKMVLEAHGERIWVESNPGEGTVFTFTLPLVPITIDEE